MGDVSRFFKRINRLRLFINRRDGWFEMIMNSDLFSEDEKNFILFNINSVDEWTLDDLELEIRGSSRSKHRLKKYLKD